MVRDQVLQTYIGSLPLSHDQRLVSWMTWLQIEGHLMTGSDKEHIVPSLLMMVVGFALMAQNQKCSPGHKACT